VTERRAAVVTISDSVAAGTSADASGPAAVRELSALDFDVVEQVTVEDGVESVSGVLVQLCEHVDLVVTTGGTGLGPRDLTPEATRAVIDREIPGISEAMRSATFGRIPFGMLSRGVAGTIGGSVVVNLPGSPKAVVEGLTVIGEALTHAVDVASGNFGRHD
jgi:molybdopterin adenylyltransferase